MTQTKKLTISLIIFLLIIVNLRLVVFAALPLVTILHGDATRLGIRLLPESKTPVTDTDIEKAMVIIRSRIEKLSSLSVTVERSQIKGEEIAILIPPGMNVAQIQEALVFRWRLEMKLVAKGTQVPYPTKAAAEKTVKTLNSATFEILIYEDGVNVRGWVVVERKPAIIANDMKEVKALVSPYGGSDYLIDFVLTPESAARFGKITGEHIGDNLAIVLNNEVKSAPVIQGQMHDRGQITGGFTKREAQNLAAALSSGELPHEIKIVSQKVISSK